MSKKYPKQAQFFNKKNIDKSIALDIWFLFLQKEKYIPFWFWKGSTKKKAPSIKEWEIVQNFWKFKLNYIYILCELFPKEFKEEIKRLTLINKETENA
jgi:hypothetical protein